MSSLPFDFHTHDLHSPPGAAIVNLPREALLCPVSFPVRPGVHYSVGIHPWWTESETEPLFAGLEAWLSRSCVVAIGECGLDRLRGGDLQYQQQVFERQAVLAERHALPVTVHCVRAFDLLLALHKQLRPSVRWTVHGFRGKPALARQLLAAGMDLSFGPCRNEDSFTLTPPSRRHEETDGSGDEATFPEFANWQKL